jgi:hypothetical protein
MQKINTEVHHALLLARRIAKRQLPKGHPVRLVAQRAVVESREAHANR